MLPIVLRIYKGKTLVEVRQFQTNQVVIGSPDSDVQVQLDDTNIAPIHAIIEKKKRQVLHRRSRIRNRHFAQRQQGFGQVLFLDHSNVAKGLQFGKT